MSGKLTGFPRKAHNLNFVRCLHHTAQDLAAMCGHKSRRIFDEPCFPMNLPRLYACGGCKHISGSSIRQTGRCPRSKAMQIAT
jgi:hypothetical protein